MKKVFRLQNLDCANCANKMEQAIAKVDGVNSVNINFIAERLTIDIDDNKFDDVMELVNKTCKKIEPDCKIVR